MSVKGVSLTFISMFIISMAVTTSGWGMSRTPPKPGYVEGQVLVRFHDDVSSERVEEIVMAERCSVRSVSRRSGLYQVILPVGQDVMDAVSRFNNYPEVQRAEPNFKAEPLEKK